MVGTAILIESLDQHRELSLLFRTQHLHVTQFSTQLNQFLNAELVILVFFLVPDSHSLYIIFDSVILIMRPDKSNGNGSRKSPGKAVR